jgi:dTDP-4-dehydrorhamnose reductase
MLAAEQIERDPPLPLLIAGLTGVAGYNAFAYFHRRYAGQVFALKQEMNWPLVGEGIVPCNVDDREQLARFFDRYQIRSVLNCGGNCALKSCELDPSMAWRLNVEHLRNVLEVIHPRPVRFVHLSIDLVFAGRGQGGHVERDRTDPVTVYGKSMAAAEQLVQLALPDSCLLRISLPMGVSYSRHAGAIDWIQWRFRHGKPATLYYDEIRTPTYTDCLNRVFHYALASDLRGLYHAGGPRPISLYQIAQVVSRVGGYDPRLLRGCYRREAGPMPPRAGNVALDSRKLADTIGAAPFDPWPFHDEHVPTHRRWHFERTRESGSFELLQRVLYRNPRPGCGMEPGTSRANATCR